MTRWASLIAVFMLLGVTAAFAQGDAGTGGVMVGSVGIIAGGISGVRGAPFMADTIAETTRVLQDGNHINQVMHGKIARDSEGRTRNESSMMMLGPEEFQHVSIHDPVQQILISFSTRGDKVAFVHHLPSFSNPSPSPPPSGNAAAKLLSPKASAGQLPPILSSSEDLGAKVIEGYTVVGKRHTRTIEAGKIGNEEPIVIVTESWYSEELHQVLLSETDDPQSGHHTMKLVNIQRIEPDPALFQAPPDFTVKDN